MTNDNSLDPENVNLPVNDAEKEADNSAENDLGNNDMEPLSKQLRELIISQEELNYAKQHKNAGAEFVSNLSSEQKDKLLAMMAKSEDNMFEFSKVKVSASKEVELARIRAKGEGVRSFKNIIYGVLAAFLIVSLVIIFRAPEYVTQWLAFVTGLGGGGLGGYGFAKSKVLDYQNKSSLDDDSE